MKSQYVSVEEAQKRIYDAAVSFEKVSMNIEDTLQYVLAEDIVANITQPPFRRSAMDGYAMRVEDIDNASRENPVRLPVAGATYAGDAPFENLPEHSAIRIMTGAPIPDEATVVIPQEMTDYGEDTVEIYRGLKPEMNCVPRGEDFCKGDVLARKGDVVDSYTIGAAVAGGVLTAEVYPKIRASIITTGNELIELGNPILPGQIYNSSKAFFKSRLSAMFCDVVSAVNVSDDKEEIREAIIKAAEISDIIFTTGGVSVGKRDYLPEVLEELGAEQLWKGIEIKPGSPTTAALYHDKIILCLSGNPYSAIAMFESLYSSYEQKVQGRNRNRMVSAEVVALNEYPKASPRRRLVRGILRPDGVWIPAGQKNGQLYSGIGSSCLVDIPEGTEKIKPGDKVKIHTMLYQVWF